MTKTKSPHIAFFFILILVGAGRARARTSPFCSVRTICHWKSDIVIYHRLRVLAKDCPPAGKPDLIVLAVWMMVP